MKYTYTYTTPDGQTHTKTVEAENRFEIYGLVRKEGGSVVTIKEGRAGLPAFNMEAVNALLSRVKMIDKILFARNLGAMLTAGLPLSRALAVMERQTKNPKLKQVLRGVAEQIQQGSELWHALERYPKVFSPLMIAMVKAGEESGKLSDSLKVIADQMERVYELKKKIHGAMIYPGIIITALTAIGALMLTFIVPTLSQTFEELGVELPATTQFIISLSNFLVHYTLWAFVTFVAAVVGVVYGLRTEAGKRVRDTLTLYVPLIGTIVREANAARTSRTLASLLSAGVSVVKAFEITEEIVQNRSFRPVLREAQERVQKGVPVSTVFQKYEYLYPPLVGELIAVGEETGKLPEMFAELAKFYENEVDQKTKNISTFIEPFLMLVVGSAVGFFAVSMLQPIYSVTNAF